MQVESVLKQLKSNNVVFENRYTGKTKKTIFCRATQAQLSLIIIYKNIFF